MADAAENVRQSPTRKVKPSTAKAESIAWTENGEFILLMDGEETKHVIVAANVIAVTEDVTI